MTSTCVKAGGDGDRGFWVKAGRTRRLPVKEGRGPGKTGTEKLATCECLIETEV